MAATESVKTGEWATESRIGKKNWHGKAWKMADYHALNCTAGGEKIEGSNAKKLGLWKGMAKKNKRSMNKAGSIFIFAFYGLYHVPSPERSK